MTLKTITFDRDHHARQWSLENGYESKRKGTEYPLRTFDVGENSALSIRLQSYNKDLNYICDEWALGYTVTLNTPGEAFKTAKQSFRVPLFEGKTFFDYFNLVHNFFLNDP